MSRDRFPGFRAQAALAAVLLSFVASLAGCEEDGKTAPDACLDPALEIYDIAAGAPAETTNPCVTRIGHSVSYIGDPTTAGTSSTGGTSGSGGKATGAGGAP
jgi:hypothetical protein